MTDEVTKIVNVLYKLYDPDSDRIKALFFQEVLEEEFPHYKFFNTGEEWILINKIDYEST
jgi:hypothetical protein